MEKYCNNCGNKGHYYRNCRHPILSYGIILYKENKDNQINIVMVERKDTLAYIEFLRGKYKSIYNILASTDKSSICCEPSLSVNSKVLVAIHLHLQHIPHQPQNHLYYLLLGLTK